MASAGMDRIKDNSETAFLTMYEQNLAIKHVHIDEWADRVKRFVYKKENTVNKVPYVKLQQLEAAFKGNKYLEMILKDKESLDWRLLTTDDLFCDLKDENGDIRDADSYEEDPNLEFQVNHLILLGLLYCKGEPELRVERFYQFL